MGCGTSSSREDKVQRLAESLIHRNIQEVGVSPNVFLLQCRIALSVLKFWIKWCFTINKDESYSQKRVCKPLITIN